VSGRIFARRDAFSPDDGWVAVSDWPDAPPGKTPSPQALACPVDGDECVALGRGFATGWVRDASEQPELAADAVRGCWRVDIDAVWRSNERPHGLDRDAFGDLMGGMGLSIDADAVTLW
jgi:hypothetical protein